MYDSPVHVIFLIGFFLDALAMFLIIGTWQLHQEEKRDKERIQNYNSQWKSNNKDNNHRS